jgi:hypothetical protein
MLKNYSLSSWLEEVMCKSFIYHESCAEKVFIENLFGKKLYNNFYYVPRL